MTDPIAPPQRMVEKPHVAKLEARISALERELAEAREAALEEAAQCVEKMQTNNVGMVHPIAVAEATAIRDLRRAARCFAEGKEKPDVKNSA